MSVEIDQSGKIEQLSVNTVVALANDCSSAVFISVSSKRKLFIKLKHSKTKRNVLYPTLFTILIFIALKQLKVFPNILLVDEEYTGKDEIIKSLLTKLILKTRPKWDGEIRFVRVGKPSPSHKLAWGIYNKNKKLKYVKIDEIEILKFLS